MSPMAGYAVALVVSAAVSLAAVPLVLRVALRRHLLDAPGGRKSHQVAVPRLGGVGIWIGWLAGLAATALGPGLLDWNRQDGAIFAGALMMFGVGLSDDLCRPRRKGDGAPRRDGLPAIVKLVLQIIAAVIPIYFGVRIRGFQVPGDGYLTLDPVLAWVLSGVWIVGITNALNFIDGLDGLAGGVSLLMAAVIAVIAMFGPSSAPGTAVCALALLGGIVGFLRLNFPPARIFMGDGGAYLLGYLLATLAISGVMKTATLIAVLTPILILALPILNLTGVVVIRVSKGQSPMSADREHLHHRLQDAGWTDLSVLLFVYAICGLCGSAALAVLEMSTAAAAMAGAVALLLVVVASRRSRSEPAAAHAEEPS